MFDFYNESLLDNCNLVNLDDLYGVFDINMRDISNKDENSELYLPFLLKEAINIFNDDKNEKLLVRKIKILKKQER